MMRFTSFLNAIFVSPFPWPNKTKRVATAPHQQHSFRKVQADSDTTRNEAKTLTVSENQGQHGFPDIFISRRLHFGPRWRTNYATWSPAQVLENSGKWWEDCNSGHQHEHAIRTQEELSFTAAKCTNNYTKNINAAHRQAAGTSSAPTRNSNENLLSSYVCLQLFPGV